MVLVRERSLLADGESKSTKAETKCTGNQSNTEARIILDRTLENFSEISEQTSPISVLHNSFHNEDNFPSPATKRAINSSENESKRLNDYLKNAKSEARDDAVQNPDHSAISTGHILKPPEINNNNLQEFQDVNQIFAALGLLKDEDLSSMRFDSANFSEDSEGFHKFEAKHKIITGEEDYTAEQLNRWLVFDAVNEILALKLRLQESISFHGKFICKNLTVHRLLKQVCDELRRLPCAPSANIDKTLGRILQKDLLHDSEGWRDSRYQLDEVALGVEQMIFMELIDEIVSDLGFCS